MSITSIDILWTALPNGRTKNSLRATVFVSPRVLLSAATTVGALAPTPLGNWPAALLNASIGKTSFAFRSPSGTTFLSGQFTSESALSPDLWTTLFAPGLPLGSGAFQNWSNRPIRTFSPSRFLGPLLQRYRDVAASEALAESFPKADKSLPLLAPVQLLVNPDVNKLLEGATTFGQIKQILSNAPGASALSPSELDLATELHRLRTFYQRPSVSQYDESAVVPPPNAPDFEFHEILNLLSDYPALLRALGLALDFEIPTALGAVPLQGQPALRFAPDFLPSAPQVLHHLPWTAYEQTDGGFYPAPSSIEEGEIRQGMLRLGNPSMFAAYQVDADGAALKTFNAARGTLRLLNTPDAPSTQSLPALRGGGIVVSRIDRGESLKKRLDIGASNNGKLAASAPQGVAVEDNILLFAEDLLRGYHVEVQDLDAKADPKPWLSLCLRAGTYRVSKLAFKIDQKSLDQFGFVRAGSVATDPGSTSGPIYAHEALFGWEGWSLVAPRPGRSISPYQENPGESPKDLAVYVDPMANKSAPLQADVRAQPNSLPRLRYGRRYRVRARTVDLAGNSAMVGAEPELPVNLWATQPIQFLRYEPVPPPTFTPRRQVAEGESVEHLVIRSDFDKTVAQYSLVSEVTNQPFSPTCERHLTPPKSSQIQVEFHGALDKLWGDLQATYELSRREAGNLFQVPGTQLYTPPSLPDGVVPTTLEQATKGDALQPGQYTFLDADLFKIPFLPDPMARGICVRPENLPSAFKVYEFEGTWPDFKPIRLVLTDTTKNAPDLSWNNGILSVGLPKGTTLKLRISSVPAAISLMALAQDLTDSALQTAAQGRHWVFSPARTLTLVHATQRPVEAPANALVPVGRAPDDTHVTLVGGLTFHGASTVRLDLRAQWFDPVDDPKTPAPTEQPYRALASSITVQPEESSFKFSLDDPDPRKRGLRHELSDTRARLVNYTVTGVSRFREYFPPGMFNDVDAFSRDSGAVSVQIPSTARPQRPQVAYAVPTFLWSESGSTRIRTGRSLRLYLERPWFSSGNGEQLAVLFSGVSSQDPNLMYTSHWAADPAWRGSLAPNNMLSTSSFNNGEVVQGPFRLEEYEGLSASLDKNAANLVAFTPVFHPERKLWYVDVDFKEPGTPYVFVRLIVARYQPNSIQGKHLSGAVRVDFVQILPERNASVVVQGANIGVAVGGPMGTNRYGLNATNSNNVSSNSVRFSYFFSAQVQRKRTSEGELAWVNLGAEIELLPSLIGPSGTLTMPTKQAGFVYRVLVREFEHYTPDLSLGLSTPQRRLVFAAPFPI